MEKTTSKEQLQERSGFNNFKKQFSRKSEITTGVRYTFLLVTTALLRSCPLNTFFVIILKEIRLIKVNILINKMIPVIQIELCSYAGILLTYIF